MAGVAAHEHEPRHARHAVDAVALAQLARRADHDLAHRADRLVGREPVVRAREAAVEAAVLLRHLVEAGVLEDEALARPPPRRRARPRAGPCRSRREAEALDRRPGSCARAPAARARGMPSTASVSSKVSSTSGSSSRFSWASRARTCGFAASRRPRSFSPKPMWRRSSFTMPSSTWRVTGSAFRAWVWNAANSIASRITFCAKSAASQSLLATSSSSRRRNTRQSARGAARDLGLGIGHAQLAQAVQQHLEVTRLVHHLRREEDLRLAGSARSRSDRSRPRARRSRRCSSCTAR